MISELWGGGGTPKIDKSNKLRECDSDKIGGGVI